VCNIIGAFLVACFDALSNSYVPPEALLHAARGQVAKPSASFRFAQPTKTFVEQQLRINDFNLLHISLDHIDGIITLPLHHIDPFDRLLIAQAMVENIPIASANSTFNAYSIQCIW